LSAIAEFLVTGRIA